MTVLTPDYSRDSLITPYAKTLLGKHYLVEGETSPQEAFVRAAEAYSGGDEALAARIYDYASRGFFMFASPVLSNAPKKGQPWKALPVSCYLMYVGDTRESIVGARSEAAWLTFMGGGIGAHVSDIRAAGPKSNGPIPFLKVMDTQMLSDRQANVRRGSIAFYMDVSHVDVMEFIASRDPAGGTGDTDRKLLNSFPAINITDNFMEAVKHDSDWHFRCPHTKEIRGTVKAREVWRRIMDYRRRTGTPYVNFIDTANRKMPKEYKDLGLTIRGSNLCQEIFIPTSEERTAVCVLSSVNLEKWDEWKDHPTFIQDLVTMLDNVVEAFIENCPPQLHKAKLGALRGRDIGLGAMGLHSLFQSKGIPFGSLAAKMLNKQIFKTIWERAEAQTKRLAIERGPAPDSRDKRNVQVMSVAPNSNNSIILDTSASIEPWVDNAFIRDTRVGQELVKNKHLEQLLEAKGKNTEEVWRSIIGNMGSVIHLDCLTDEEKEVFKTAFEIDQRWIVELAADRQEYIDQGQSLNLFFDSESSNKLMSDVHLMAWEKGLKSLYYLRSKAASRPNLTAEVKRVALKSNEDGGCLSCEG